MNKEQQAAFDRPMLGRQGETPYLWRVPPWSFALSFNR